MKKTLLSILILISFNSHSQNLPFSLPKDFPIELPKLNNFQPVNPSLKFDQMPLGNLINLYFQEMNTSSFIISDEVLKDTRLYSLKFDSKKDGNIKIFIENLIESAGYEIKLINKTYFINKKPENISKIEEEKIEIFEIYRPKFRTTTYLSNLIRPIYQKNLTQAKAIENTSLKATTSKIDDNSSASAQLDSNSDVIIFKSYEQNEINNIKLLLEKLDIEEKNLILKAHIYEVNYTNTDNSAINIVTQILNNSLNINLGSTTILENSLKLTLNNTSLLFSAIQKDSRFNLVSNPFLRIKNNKTSSLKVGASVPFSDQLSVLNNGSQVQSTKQIDTGFILQVTPQIKENSIDLDLNQSISEAQQSEKNTPTITKREINTSLTAKKNELILLAGLTQFKENDLKTKAFILPFGTSKNKSSDKTEIIILMEIVETETIN